VLAKELELKIMMKIIVATFQILGNISIVLAITMPEIFGDFLLSFMAFFKFDLVGVFRLGCVSDGSYLSGLLINLGIVGMVLVLVLIDYLYETHSAHMHTFDGSQHDDTAEQHLKDIFEEFDREGNGINAEDIWTVMKKVDGEVTQEEAEEMFRETDKDNSGTIEWTEFHDAALGETANSEKPDHDRHGGLARGKSHMHMLVKNKILHNIKADCITRTFMLIFIVYPNMTSKIFEAFACRDIGTTDSVLHSDYGLDCTSSDYTMIYWLCVFLMFIFPIGMPLLLFYMMSQVKELIQVEDQEVMREFGFVINDYKLSHWYWEVVELSRKLILSGVIGMFRRGSITQIVAATSISFGFALFAYREQPYHTARMNFIKITSEIQLFLIMLLCVVLQTEAQGVTRKGLENLGNMQVVVCLSILPITAAALAQGVVDMRDDIKADLANESGGLFRSAKKTGKQVKDLPGAMINPMAEGLIVIDSDDEDNAED
jgi:hypothetical protein